MMRKLALVLSGLSILTASAETYYTHPVSDDLHTLQVIADGDFRKLPMMDNTGRTGLEISFDILSDDKPYLQYYVVHCDAQWEQDDLSELDYLNGFMPVRVEDVQPSFNTYVNYWHYRVPFPNEDVELLLSGNYAVVFHTEDDPDDIQAVACFSVTEQMAFVNGEVSGNTDIDYLREHQQLTLQCAWSQNQLPHLDPTSDLRLVVTQNHRPSTRRDILRPSRIEGGKAWYEHQPDLIFEAGNTYRRFEFIDRHYATFGIDQLGYHAPYYETLLSLQHARSNGFYLYDQDQHGRYLVHALGVDDEVLESEYFWAEFRLAGAMPPRNGAQIYLSGDFTYGELSEPYRMEYDPVTECFTARVLLKQGHYNYQFLCGPAWNPDFGTPFAESDCRRITTGVCEGNYYESHNEYDVYVYYRAPGARYDRLLGVAQF